MDRMNLTDMLDFYAVTHNSNNWNAMLLDYTLNENLNRDDLNNVILKELGNACPYVTDTTTFKFALDTFFTKYKYNIDKLVETLNIEYNPIHNKNYFRETDEEHKGEKHQGTEKITDEDTTDKYDADNKLNVSAYNDGEDVYTPKNQSLEHNEDVLDKYVKENSKLNENDKKTSDIDEHIYGTDGSYQDLIEKERKIAQFNIYNWIIERMRKELFLLVY